MSTIAYVAIALGYLGFVLKPTALFPVVFPNAAKSLNPHYQFVSLTTAEFIGAITWVALGSLFSFVQFLGGIGLLKMRYWGRRLLFVYATAAVVMTLWQTVYRVVNLQRVVELQNEATTQPIDPMQLQQDSILQTMVMTVALLLWPAILFTVLTRRHVREALEARRKADG